MQRKRRRLARLFFGLAWTAFGIGCGGKPAPSEKPDAPPKGTVLHVACPDETTAALVAGYAPAWANRNQAQVETTVYDARTRPDAATAADVWVLPPAEMPRWAATGRLAPIPPEVAAAGLTGLLPLYRDKLLLWDRTPYALPLRGEAPLCYYRTDLLGDADRRTAYEAKFGRKLAPPRTWEEFADIAEFFQAGSGALAHGLPPWPRDDGALEDEFYTLAACYARRAVAADETPGPDRAGEMFAFHYDLKTGRPRIAGPGFVYALALMQRLRKCRPEQASATPTDAFRRGEAVLCLADGARLMEFQTGDDTKVRDRFGVCRTPAGGCYFPPEGGDCRPARDGNYVPYLGAGGRLGVVPKDAPFPVAAFSLLADLSGRETGGQLVISSRFGGDPIRSDQLDEQTSWAGFDLKPETAKAFREALQQALLHRAVQNPVLRLRTPDEREHRTALAAALRAALETPNADPKQALEAAARRWEEIDSARGKARLADYRISIGLLPDAE